VATAQSTFSSLNESQDQDMQNQLASFEKEFNSWKGDREQIDDVCVMGVRIT